MQPMTVTSSCNTIGSEKTNEDICMYLQAVINPLHFDLVETYVRRLRSNCTAFSHIIFARIIEDGCTRVGVPYTERCNHTTQVRTVHDTIVNMEDVIQTFGFIAQTTFSNFRNLHFYVCRAVDLLQLVGDQLERVDREYLESLKRLLEVDLHQQELAKIYGPTFGTLVEIGNRLRLLLDPKKFTKP
jgi:hypothetical protein